MLTLCNLLHSNKKNNTPIARVLGLRWVFRPEGAGSIRTYCKKRCGMVQDRPGITGLCRLRRRVPAMRLKRGKSSRNHAKERNLFLQGFLGLALSHCFSDTPFHAVLVCSFSLHVCLTCSLSLSFWILVTTPFSCPMDLGVLIASRCY